MKLLITLNVVDIGLLNEYNFAKPFWVLLRRDNFIRTA
jgi:hypothetical protein